MHCLNVLAHMLIVNTGQHTFNGTRQHFLLVLKYINEVINLSQSKVFVCVDTTEGCVYGLVVMATLSFNFFRIFGVNHGTCGDTSVQPVLRNCLPRIQE